MGQNGYRLTFRCGSVLVSREDSYQDMDLLSIIKQDASIWSRDRILLILNHSLDNSFIENSFLFDKIDIDLNNRMIQFYYRFQDNDKSYPTYRPAIITRFEFLLNTEEKIIISF
jgi:hypothetical protein